MAKVSYNKLNQTHPYTREENPLVFKLDPNDDGSIDSIKLLKPFSSQEDMSIADFSSQQSVMSGYDFLDMFEASGANYGSEDEFYIRVIELDDLCDGIELGRL